MSTPSHLAALRHHGNYAKPAPPMRKNASATGMAAAAGSSQLDSSFPPPPPPISCSGEPELTGSNSTTPRGSMENLPPPPPHLLLSDEDEPHQLRDASPQVTISSCDIGLEHGILKREVSLYHWPPVWLDWNQVYDNWQFLYLFAKQMNPNQSNRRSMVQWYLPLPWLEWNKKRLIETNKTGLLLNRYLQKALTR